MTVQNEVEFLVCVVVQSQHIADLEVRLNSARSRRFSGPFNRCRRNVHTMQLEPVPGQIEHQIAGTATQFQKPSMTGQAINLHQPAQYLNRLPDLLRITPARPPLSPEPLVNLIVRSVVRLHDCLCRQWLTRCASSWRHGRLPSTAGCAQDRRTYKGLSVGCPQDRSTAALVRDRPEPVTHPLRHEIRPAFTCGLLWLPHRRAVPARRARSPRRSCELRQAAASRASCPTCALPDGRG